LGHDDIVELDDYLESITEGNAWARFSKIQEMIRIRLFEGNDPASERDRLRHAKMLEYISKKLGLQ
jgi:hypothetical protein